MTLPRTEVVATVLALLTVGCGVNKAPSKAAPPIETSELPLNEFMAHVIQPNAKEMWRWDGVVADQNGVRDRLPRSTPEWEDAEGAALTLVELSYALQQADRHRGRGWDLRVKEFRSASAAAAAAAKVQDAKTWSASGDAVNTACVECHYAFAPHLEPPRAGY